MDLKQACPECDGSRVISVPSGFRLCMNAVHFPSVAPTLHPEMGPAPFGVCSDWEGCTNPPEYHVIWDQATMVNSALCRDHFLASMVAGELRWNDHVYGPACSRPDSVIPFGEYVCTAPSRTIPVLPHTFG